MTTHTTARGGVGTEKPDDEGLERWWASYGLRPGNQPYLLRWRWGLEAARRHDGNVDGYPALPTRVDKQQPPDTSVK